MLAEMNVPLKAIMQRVGHNDPNTTLQIYTHVTENMKAETRAKLVSKKSAKKVQKGCKKRAMGNILSLSKSPAIRMIKRLETFGNISHCSPKAVAERVGFEPTVRCRITSFQD